MEIYTYRIALYQPAGSTTAGSTTAGSTTGGAAANLPDLTGWDVEATDGHIGKVDEATYEDASSCLVVDTGFWIFGKKRMIPPEWCSASTLRRRRRLSR